MELNANFNDELNKQLKEAKAKVKEEKEKHDKYGPQKFYMKWPRHYDRVSYFLLLILFSDFF